MRWSTNVRLPWTTLGLVAKQLRADIDIAAPPQQVWRILTDFARYPEWNPFIIEAEGTLEVGQQLRVVIRPPGEKARTFRPTVRTIVPPRTFSWLGRFGIPGVFDGEHVHEVHPRESGGCRYVQSERFSGVLVPFTGTLLAATDRGFHDMCRALKERAER
jgi:hypothetical protein